jgi:antirestriction protein
MHEQQPPRPEQPEADGLLWDPNEQVGDIYEVELDGQGQVLRADELDTAPSETDPNATEHASQTRPSIWIGSWLDYNNGILHGDWIPADRDDAAVWADIQTMLGRSPTAAETGETAEDWGIFDYENFDPLRIGEQEAVAWVAKVARGIAEHGLAYAAWADSVQEDLLENFTDAYLGHYDSVEAYVEQLVDDLGYDELLDHAVPDGLRPYVQIDTASMARDMQLSGDVHVVTAGADGVWLFDAR